MNMAMATRNPQLTGNVGLYYCCYRLSLLGWNVMPTARNARGVDIIAYSQDATKILTIQVKSLSKRNPVPLGPTKDKIMGDFWVIVNKIDGAPETDPSAFVLTPRQVRDLAVQGEKDGRISHWLQPTAYDKPKFKEAWEIVGRGFCAPR